jgi:hypothetical protein
MLILAEESAEAVVSRMVRWASRPGSLVGSGSEVSGLALEIPR